MTDLEILKEIEKELGESLYDTGRYITNEDGHINFITLFDLEKIPNSLLSLTHLSTIKLNECKTNNFLPLLKLENLKKLEIDYDSTVSYTLELRQYIKKATNLKALYIAFFLKTKRLSYVDFLLSIDSIKDIKKEYLDIDFSEDYANNKTFTFPLLSMLNLGYNDINLCLDYFFSNPHAKIFQEKTPAEDEISGKLLEIFYKDYQKNEFPCAIRKIRIFDYHGIDNLLIDNIAVDNGQKTINDPHWIFLTGENGYGKTSILQAIVIGLYGKEDKQGVILDKKKEANIFLELKENTNPEFKDRHGLRINHAGKDTEYDIGWITPSMFTKFAAYGASRLNISNDEKNQTYSLFNSDGTLFNIENSLKLWNNDIDNHELYKNIRHILLELLSPYIDDLKINKKNGDYTLVYHETETPAEDWKIFEELASGYKNIIATFGDMILRLRREQPKVRNAKDLAGIVIIDEFDLHLHPKWQKELVEKLTKTFPKIQFIVSTHSPIPLLGAPKNSIIINVQRSKEEGITARKLDIDFTKLTPNSMLSSPIFGFDAIFSNQTTADEVETADNYEDIENDERLRKKFNILKRTDEDFFNDLIGEE